MSKGLVAVIVLSHRDPVQISRLVDRITAGADAVAVIHHDPTGEPLSLKPSSSVAVIPDPVHCEWGRLSLVEAQWKSLHWVAENIPEFSWALLVSGQDYPIRSMSSIAATLSTSPHDAYLRHFRVGDPADDVIAWQALTRRRYLYKRRLPFSRRSVALPIARRHPYHRGVDLYVGDMWFNLSAGIVRAMLDAEPLANRLLRYLRFAPIPDETFVCSMALNALPSPDVVSDSKRFIKWSGQHRLHPDIISAAHLDEIRASDAFFARKIDAEAHPDITDILDDIAARRS